MSQVVARSIASVTTQSATLVQWWVIVEKRMTFQLHLLNLSTSQTDTTVIHDLRKKYESTRPTRHWWHAKPMISEAIVSPFCIGDPEVQDYPRDVFIASNAHRPDLTDAFNNPNLLRSATNFMNLNKQFNILPAGETPDGHRRAVLITNDVNKNILTWVIGTVTLLAIVVGVIAGLLVDSSFGVATSTGLISIFLFVQGCIFAIYK